MNIKVESFAKSVLPVAMVFAALMVSPLPPAPSARGIFSELWLLGVLLVVSAPTIPLLFEVESMKEIRCALRQRWRRAPAWEMFVSVSMAFAAGELMRSGLPVVAVPALGVAIAEGWHANFVLLDGFYAEIEHEVTPVPSA